MRRLPRLALAYGLALGAFAVVAARSTGQERPAQGAAFRSGVDLVSLTVTVTDGSHRYVTDLGAGDFSVFEDGVLQDVSFFSPSSLPLAVSLLLDTSASMEDRLGVAQTAAIGFVRHLRPQDSVQVVDFDSKVSVVAPMSKAKHDLERVIRSTTAGGSTSLFNAVYISLRELNKTRARSSDELRRQAIVVLSDGEDNSSLVSFEEVLELAKRSETAIYAVGLRSIDPLAGKAYSEAHFVLRQLTGHTGGRLFFPEKADELPAIYEQISQELSSQYLVGYSSRNARRDGTWRRLLVRAARPGTTARTRLGYYAPSS